MDQLSKERRSWNMSRIKNENTKPELIVRRLLWRMGYRYRLHDATLPGKPDIVFKSRRKVIFVHGCFWHQHKKCKKGVIPQSNVDFWIPKLRKNIERDSENYAALQKLGWNVCIIWECELKNHEANQQILSRKLADLLGNK